MSDTCEDKASKSSGSKITCTSPILGFGAAMAMILSFDHNRSILWMIVHGFLGWAYVIYRAIFG